MLWPPLSSTMGFIIGLFWITTVSSLATKGLRVNRALWTTHSRREANRLIAQGRIQVNNVTTASPDERLTAGDVVQFDGDVIDWQQENKKPHLYFKFHKPRRHEQQKDQGISCHDRTASDQRKSQGACQWRKHYDFGKEKWSHGTRHGTNPPLLGRTE